MDTSNQFEVVCKDGMVQIRSGGPLGLLGMPTAEAINLAAWIFLVADPSGETFDRIVKEAKAKI